MGSKRKDYELEVQSKPKSGLWTYLKMDDTRHNYFVCRCDCGRIRNVRADTYLDEVSGSCGCVAAAAASLRVKTHGLSKHPMYEVHHGMLRRCYNPERKDYKHYGGRGITMQDSWLGVNGLENFIVDMYPTYKEGLEIDRKNVNGNYTKENCGWASRREQTNNQRRNVTLTFEGISLSCSEWAHLLGISSKVIGDRIDKLGWPVEIALTKKFKLKNHIFNVCGDVFTIKSMKESFFKSMPMNKYLELVKRDETGSIVSKLLGVPVSREATRHRTLSMETILDFLDFKNEVLTDDFSLAVREKVSRNRLGVQYD